MNNSSRTFGLLIEIVLSAVFFAVICAAVLELFLQAQVIGERSRDRSSAIAVAQSIGDIFRSDDDFDSLLNRVYEDALRENEDGYEITLDESLSPSAIESGQYAQLRIEDGARTTSGHLQSAFIEVVKNEDVLYSLRVDVYRLGGGS